MIFWTTSLLQEHANWTSWSLSYFSTSGTCQLDLMIFELLLYFRNMPTGLHDLLNYFSTSETCQLDFMIFELLLYFRNMPTGLDDLLNYFSASGACQLDFMIFWIILLYFRNMPTGLNDLWATSLLQEHANWTSWSFELLLYFRNMPTGLDDLLNYFSTSGTCQLDTMIFVLTILQNHPWLGVSSMKLPLIMRVYDDMLSYYES